MSTQHSQVLSWIAGGKPCCHWIELDLVPTLLADGLGARCGYAPPITVAAAAAAAASRVRVFNEPPCEYGCLRSIIQ
jgi:hypothetical protein